MAGRPEDVSPPAEAVGTTGPDDRALLAAHVEGDPEAFGALFRRHRDRLWAVALRTTGDPEEAADALQDALVSAFRRASSYRGDASVTTWLHRIVVNACLDRLRRRSLRVAEPLADDVEKSSDHSPWVSGPSAGTGTTDPADIVLDADQRARVLEALATLPPEQRAALVLVDMEGYSVAEAAEILECAHGTVKSRCARGRARLLPLLSGLRDQGVEGVTRRPGTEPPAPKPRPSTEPVGGGERE